MFKNPLKYQQGGKAKQASQEQLVQLFQAAAKNAQVDPQELVQKASELGNDEQTAAQFMQGLQLCAQGDPKGIEFIKSLFQQPAYKKGGKILDFICKHAKGGYVSGCGCGGNVKKAQDGAQFKAPTNYYNENGRGKIGRLGSLNEGYIQNSLQKESPYNYSQSRFGENPYYTKQIAEPSYNQLAPDQYWPLYNAFYRYPSPVTISGEPLNNRVEGPQETLAGMKCGGKVKSK